MCMQDEEVFSLVYLFSLPMFCVQLNFSFTPILSMQILELVELRIKQFFSERLLIDIPALIFSSTSVEIYFWQPIFWGLSLANQIGFCAEKYVSKPFVLFGSHLLAICCAYLTINSSTCLGLGLRWLRTEARFTPKRSILRFSISSRKT